MSTRNPMAAGSDVPDEPMMPGNHEAKSDRCFIGESFKSIVVKSKSFEWLNDSNGRAEKWGYISTVRAAELQIKVNTLANQVSQGVPTT